MYSKPKVHDLTGRLALRVVWEWFMVDETAKALYSINHLQDLPYPGDDYMVQFILDWRRILADQESNVTEVQKDRIFYKKIRNSKALRTYLDHYNRLDESKEDHSYTYFINSYDSYLKKTRKDRHLNSLVGGKGAHGDPTGGGGKGDPTKRKATPARHAQQCPFWLKPGGCRDPANCTLGPHDPEFQGKGKAPTPEGKGKGKGDADGKGKGKGKGQEKGNKGETKAPVVDALKAADGREACLKFMAGECDNPDCPRFHGPFTKAMKAAYAKWKADRDARAAKRAAAPAEAAAGADAGGAAAAKAKAKAKDGKKG